MKYFMEHDKHLHHASRVLFLAGVMVSMAVCAATSTSSAASQETPQYMFVQVAEHVKVDAAAKNFRLIIVTQQTLYFTDRPERIAGHIKMDAYLKEWTAQAGKDNFGADPPNAVLSVYEPGQPDNTTAVVEITQPKIDGSDLTYSYKLIRGRLPAGGGATSLFIDWIGVGGGVGRGYWRPHRGRVRRTEEPGPELPVGAGPAAICRPAVGSIPKEAGHLQPGQFRLFRGKRICG